VLSCGCLILRSEFRGHQFPATATQVEADRSRYLLLVFRFGLDACFGRVSQASGMPLTNGSNFM
jgi:hypothetical protein